MPSIPKVQVFDRMGEYLGDFDYDPELVAQGIHRGYDLRPHPDTMPSEIERHKVEIDSILRKLRGNQKFRVGDIRNTYKQTSSFFTPYKGTDFYALPGDQSMNQPSQQEAGFSYLGDLGDFYKNRG